MEFQVRIIHSFIGVVSADAQAVGPLETWSIVQREAGFLFQSVSYQTFLQAVEDPSVFGRSESTSLTTAGSCRCDSKVFHDVICFISVWHCIQGGWISRILDFELSICRYNIVEKIEKVWHHRAQEATFKSSGRDSKEETNECGFFRTGGIVYHFIYPFNSKLKLFRSRTQSGNRARLDFSEQELEELAKAREEGKLHEALLERRSKVKADRYCKWKNLISTFFYI